MPMAHSQMPEPPIARQETLSLPQAVQRAALYFQQGQLLETEHLCRQILKAKPDQFDALHILGVIKLQQRNNEDGVTLITVALRENPKSAEALSNLALGLTRLNRDEEAIAACNRALAIEPDHVAALIHRGVALEKLHRHEEAIASYDRALVIKPEDVEAHYYRGNALSSVNRYEEAITSYDRALAAKPDYLEALSNRGVALGNLRRYEEAAASYNRALAIKPDYAEVLHNCGITLAKLHRYGEAIASYDKALAINPDDVEVLNDRGVALEKLDWCHEAIVSYDRALAIKPDYVEAHNNRGLALENLGRREEAIASYDRALAVKPDYVEALNNRGISLAKLNQHERAIATYDEALAIKPELVEALHNRGNALTKLNCFHEALDSYDKALAIKPDLAEALYRRGIALRVLNRHEEAIASHERVLAIEPENPHTLTELAECHLAICRWDETARLARELNDHVVEEKSIIEPLLFLHYGSEPSKQLLCARQYLRDVVKIPSQPIWDRAIYCHDKIRIAYLSADFHRHATAFLTAELFELHDRTRFEVMGVSFGTDDGSELRSRLVKSFDRFRDVRAKSDQDVAALLNDLEIDIAVDLKGHTANARPAILAYRPAPIQVSYLGYPGTTGAEFIDYVIADKVVLPFDQQAFYTEKIVHLPGCYQVNDSKRPISPYVPTRSGVGLPEEGLVFCCFNNSLKITAPVFDVWMRLLQAIGGSVLWLFRSNDAAAGNLRREAEARGVDPARLVFAGKLSLEDHLARHRLADLFLDTLPVNAHTTASDALWAGLPVLTCMGATFAGRVAASLLYAVGLPELVTTSLEDYEALAMKLASEPALLRSVRRKLEANRLSCPLFDTDRFRWHIEAAYTTMWELWQRGESLRSFSVDPVQAAEPDG